jgi:uncharacterized protein (TIGR03437 family)
MPNYFNSTMPRNAQRRFRSLSSTFFLTALLFSAFPPPLRCQIFTTLFAFDGSNGFNPMGPLLEGTDGSFYGVTLPTGVPIRPGPSNGTIFQLTQSGVLTTLHTFASPVVVPQGGLLQASDGTLYGTTDPVSATNSDSGTIFRITPAGNFTTIYSFAGVDGMSPNGSLIQGSDGNLYGTTQGGGTNGWGTMFKITTTGSLTTLHNFTGTDGGTPSPLFLGNDGYFYGTTPNEVFKASSSGVVTTLYTFPLPTVQTPYPPEGGVIQAADGNLYGVTSRGGGTIGIGTVFQITPAGAFTVIYTFTVTNPAGGNPKARLFQGADGYLYGSTTAYGSGAEGAIFRLSTTGDLTMVHPFTFNDGQQSYGPIIQARNGSFVGTVTRGDAAEFNYGYIFKFLPVSGGLPPSINNRGIVPIFSSYSEITPGEWVSIYGSNLSNTIANWNGDFPTSLGGTTVTVNSLPAYLAYVSPVQINLQVPDVSLGPLVPVVVSTAAGSATLDVGIAGASPSLFLLDAEHVAGIILRDDGSGAYGGGSYDILGPTGTTLGYRTVAAKAGDKVTIFGTGFGPTNPQVPAGEAFSGAAPTVTSVTLTINSVKVFPTFAGLSGAGLDQVNLVVPSGLGTGDVPLQATMFGSNITQPGVVISLQ